MRRARMAVENNDRLLKAVLSCVADGVFTVDDKFRITSFNRRAERITGVAAGDALGKRCSDILQADICKEQCPVRRMMESDGEIADQPAQILVNTPHSTAVSVSSALLRKNGRFLGAVQAFREAVVTVADVPQPAEQKSAAPRRRSSPLGLAEADAIRRTLSAAGGHIGRAAKELGISRTTLWRKMRKHGIRTDE
jgi:PAS domain S-box-containing protein